MDIDWQFLLSAQVVDAVLLGLRTTLYVSFYSAIGAIFLGVVAGLFQTSGRIWLIRFGKAYVTFFRNVPLLVLLFFFYFGLPLLFPPREFPILYTGGYEVTVAILAISVAWGAFVAEVVRSGIEAIPFGQLEAALASGLSKGQAFRHIVFPQLGPIILPGMSNEMVNIVKSTSLAMTIGVNELIWQAQQIEAETFRGFEAMTAVTVVYLVLSLSIFGIFWFLERVTRIK